MDRLGWQCLSCMPPTTHPELSLQGLRPQRVNGKLGSNVSETEGREQREGSDFPDRPADPGKSSRWMCVWGLALPFLAGEPHLRLWSPSYSNVLPRHLGASDPGSLHKARAVQPSLLLG